MQLRSPSVLVVEPEEQAHGVLEAALAPQGVRVFAARFSREALDVDLRHASDVIVADDECDVSELLAGLRRAGRIAPRVLVLGDESAANSLPALRKPYDCRTLIRKIEAMLAVEPDRMHRSGESFRRAA